MTVRQFEIFHLEPIPIKLPPIGKVTCFRSGSICQKMEKKRTDKDVWRGWKKVTDREKILWDLKKKISYRNWGVVLPLLFRLPSLTCEARFRLGIEIMWRISLNNILLKIGWNCKNGSLTVFSYLARQRLLGLPCPPTTSPDHNHQIMLITRSSWSPDPDDHQTQTITRSKSPIK